MVDELQRVRSMLLIVIFPFLFSYAFAQEKQAESGDVEFYLNRGITFYYKGQYDQAISDFTQALEINPRDAGAQNNRGIAYYFKRKYDKSWEDVKKAQNLGYQVHPGFLEELRRASGRQN